LALLVFNRPPDVFVGLGLGIAIMLWQLRSWWVVGLGGMAAGLPFLAYNLHSGGNILGVWGQYSPMGTLFPYPIEAGLLGLLVSPMRGILVFAPFLAFTAAGVWRSWQVRDRIALAVAAGVALEIWFYALTDYRAGHCYGARYLLDLVPAMIWLMAPAVPQLAGWRRAAFVAAIVFSVWVQYVGAFRYTGQSNVDAYGDQHDPLNFSSPIWQPTNVQWLLERNNRPTMWRIPPGV
jgi:hypothetical protein